MNFVQIIMFLCTLYSIYANYTMFSNQDQLVKTLDFYCVLLLLVSGDLFRHILLLMSHAILL